MGASFFAPGSAPNHPLARGLEKQRRLENTRRATLSRDPASRCSALRCFAPRVFESCGTKKLPEKVASPACGSTRNWTERSAPLPLIQLIDCYSPTCSAATKILPIPRKQCAYSPSCAPMNTDPLAGLSLQRLPRAQRNPQLRSLLICRADASL